MRRLICILILLCGLVPRACLAGELDRGLAVTDPVALRALESAHGEHPGFALGRLIDPAGPLSLANDALFALPAMAAVRSAIDAEFDRYVLRQQTRAARSTTGGPPAAPQLFDRAALFSDRTRFALAGIVNRMDRAYLDSARCGEIRLIYRLRLDDDGGAPGAAPPQLPMTLTVVLQAADGTASSCAGIATRWLAVGEPRLSGAARAARMIAPDGPLAALTPAHIIRLETNLQIAHIPRSPDRPFRTDYLLKLFQFDQTTRAFAEAKLENQIDTDLLLANDTLRRDFKAWLLRPARLAALDRGTILIPEKFLAFHAIASMPAGFARSAGQPAHDLMAPPTGTPTFDSRDVVAALKQAAGTGIVLRNIRSTAGFERRLNDITCAGCHQTRGIGGFHFPGAATADPGAVAGSPLFVGDQIRRRDIVLALRDGRPPDFSRGFADRPQLRGDTALRGNASYDGWGAHCYQRRADAANDPSFRSWTCAAGLTCQPFDASRFGMCFVK